MQLRQKFPADWVGGQVAERHKKIVDMLVCSYEWLIVKWAWDPAHRLTETLHTGYKSDVQVRGRPANYSGRAYQFICVLTGWNGLSSQVVRKHQIAFAQSSLCCQSSALKVACYMCTLWHCDLFSACAKFLRNHAHHEISSRLRYNWAKFCTQFCCTAGIVKKGKNWMLNKLHFCIKISE